MTVADRFWSKVQKTQTCWNWTGGLGRGYGRFYLAGCFVVAHRFAYEAEHGPIPDGKELDHLCRNRRCVRPSHLRVVDHRTNVLAGVGTSAQNAAMTACPKGHPLEQYGKQRRCLTCYREKASERHFRKWLVARRAGRVATSI